MSAPTDLAALAEPELRAYATADPGQGRFDHAPLEGERRLVLELVHEAYLLHYGEPRVFAGMDADLRLLAGDALYAAGVARLAESGDLEAVAELADLIAGCARAHAEDRPTVADELWDASVAALSREPGRGAAEVIATSLARASRSA